MADIIFIGLSLGSILLLIALGLTIIYGAMGVINMAHGELAMIGAYTAVMAGLHLDLNLVLCIPLAFAVTAVLGWLIERLVIRRLYSRIMDTLLATWGIALLLQQMIRLSLGLAFFGITIEGMGTGLQSVTLPETFSQVWRIGDFVLQPYRSFIILVTLGLAGSTWWLMYRTAFGIQVRAIMRNPEMAAACGIDVRRVSSFTFAYGSGLAGVAGVLLAGLKTVSPDMGASLVVDGFSCCRGRGRRQPDRYGRLRWAVGADQWCDRHSVQRHPCPRHGAWPRDLGHNVAARRALQLQGALI